MHSSNNLFIKRKENVQLTFLSCPKDFRGRYPTGNYRPETLFLHRRWCPGALINLLRVQHPDDDRNQSVIPDGFVWILLKDVQKNLHLMK